MRTARRATGLIAALAALLLGVIPAANAATATRVDARGDAPRFIDISRVKYGNTDHRVYARIGVPGLERRGQARLGMRGRTDQGFQARVRVRADGSLSKRFYEFNNGGIFERRPCDLRARWGARDNVVLISVPQSCVEPLGGRALDLSASTGWRQADYAPHVRRLPRG